MYSVLMNRVIIYQDTNACKVKRVRDFLAVRNPGERITVTQTQSDTIQQMLYNRAGSLAS